MENTESKLAIDGAFVLTVLNRALAEYFVHVAGIMKSAEGMEDQAVRVARAEGMFSACNHILKVVTQELMEMVSRGHDASKKG